MLSNRSIYLSSAFLETKFALMVLLLVARDSGSGMITETSLIRCTLSSSSIGPYTSPSSIDSSASSNSEGRNPSVSPRSPPVSFVPASSETSVTKSSNFSPLFNLILS